MATAGARPRAARVPVALQTGGAGGADRVAAARRAASRAAARATTSRAAARTRDMLLMPLMMGCMLETSALRAVQPVLVVAQRMLIVAQLALVVTQLPLVAAQVLLVRISRRGVAGELLAVLPQPGVVACERGAHL